MTGSSKKPPPDTLENVQGRIYALHLMACQNAAVDTREGIDREQALSHRIKAIEPTLKKLKCRLEKLQRTGNASSLAKSTESAKKAEMKAEDSKSKIDWLSILDSL